ncbi:flagellar motor switch protein FliM [Salinispira pacifica]|uniref:Flagellar motor switch protein FliM n=1 Tax=Salinispira pacifica TaxID=1307761 RepID=V5WJX1_9SPIO|nr:FliM/FliN family flagellar motor switch protein [Salinispira pacifica]AHC16097.1 Flagellar motor switch protein FliM [Salinispira pacifica]
MPEYPDYYDPEIILGHKGTAGDELRIKAYDFTRPDKFSWFQIRTISLVHEILSRKLTDRLSGLLEVKPKISVSMVDQSTFQEFLDLCNPRSLFAVYRFHESSGAFLLQSDPAGNNLLLDSFAGSGQTRPEQTGSVPGSPGTGSPVTDGQVPGGQVARGQVASGPETIGNVSSLTELEIEILSPLYHSLAGDLGSAWWFFEDDHIRLEGMENDTQFARIIPPNEMVVFAEIDISTSLGSWKLRCVYPYITLESRLEQLSFSYWYTRIRPGGSSLGRDRVSRLPVQAGVELLIEPLTLRELERLKPGDSLEIPLDAMEQCRIRANGKDIEKCTVSSLEGERLEIAPILPGSNDREREDHLMSMIRREIREGLAHSLPRLQQLSGDSAAEGRDERRNPARGSGNLNASREKPGDKAALNHWAQSSRGLQNGFPGDGREYGDESPGVIQTLTVNQGAFLHQLMSPERVSIQAALLMQLGHALGADYLARSESRLREHIVRRLSTCSSQPDFFHAALNGYIRRKLDDYRNPVHMNCSGIEKTVEILNYSPEWLKWSW